MTFNCKRCLQRSISKKPETSRKLNHLLSRSYRFDVSAISSDIKYCYKCCSDETRDELFQSIFNDDYNNRYDTKRRILYAPFPINLCEIVSRAIKIREIREITYPEPRQEQQDSLGSVIFEEIQFENSSSMHELG